MSLIYYESLYSFFYFTITYLPRHTKIERCQAPRHPIIITDNWQWHTRPSISKNYMALIRSVSTVQLFRGVNGISSRGEQKKNAFAEQAFWESVTANIKCIVTVAGREMEFIDKFSCEVVCIRSRTKCKYAGATWFMFIYKFTIGQIKYAVVRSKNITLWTDKKSYTCTK